MEKVAKEFAPNISHPLFFVRRGLLRGIRKYSKNLKGVLMDFGSGSKPYRILFEVEKYIGVDYEGEGHLHDMEEIDYFYDGKHLPFDDNHFDSVFASEVFEHIFNLPQILPEIARVLKSKGDILITCPFVWVEHEIPVDYARYTRFALIDMLEQNGFEIISFEKAGSFITTITQMWVIYNVQFLKPKFGFLNRFILMKFCFRLFFVFLPNLGGYVLNKVLPMGDTLYQNNIIYAKKR